VECELLFTKLIKSFENCLIPETIIVIFEKR